MGFIRKAQKMHKPRIIQEKYKYGWAEVICLILTVFILLFYFNIFGIHRWFCVKNPSNPRYALIWGINELSCATNVEMRSIITEYTEDLTSKLIDKRSIGFPRVNYKNTSAVDFWYDTRSSNLFIDCVYKDKSRSRYIILYVFTNNEEGNLSELEKLYSCFVLANQETYPALSTKKLMTNAKEKLYSHLRNSAQAHGYIFFIFICLSIFWDIVCFYFVANSRLNKMKSLYNRYFNRDEYKSFLSSPDISQCLFVLNCESLFSKYEKKLSVVKRIARIAISSGKTEDYQSTNGKVSTTIALGLKETYEEQLLSKIEKCLTAAKEGLEAEELQNFQHLIQEANRSKRKSKREYYLESALKILSRENPGCIEEKQNGTNGMQIVSKCDDPIQITSENIAGFLQIGKFLPEEIDEDHAVNTIIWGFLCPGKKRSSLFGGIYAREEIIRSHVSSKMQERFDLLKFKIALDWLHKENVIHGNEFKRKTHRDIYSLNPLANTARSENSAKIIRRIIEYKQFIDRETSI